MKRTLIKAEMAVLVSIATYLINHQTNFRFENGRGIIVYLPLIDLHYFLINVGFNDGQIELKKVKL